MKILLIRFSSIGDIVLCTPVIRCLKKQTGAEIHFLTKSRFAEILEHNPYIDRLWRFDREPDELIPDLRKAGFDWVIDLHNNLRSWKVRLLLGRPSRGFPKLNLRKWLLVRTGINSLPNRHIVDRYFDAVRYLNVAYDGKGLDYFIDPATETAAAVNDPRWAGRPFTVFVIGATHATKRMPAEQIATVCRLLPAPVVLLGGPAEQQAGREIAEEVGDAVIDLCGRLRLAESAAVLRKAAVVISHDTGLMHIAAALRRPIVSLWGSTVPEFGMTPFYPAEGVAEERLEISGLSCRPCSKIGYDRCPRGHFRCMRDIRPEMVARAQRAVQDSAGNVA